MTTTTMGDRWFEFLNAFTPLMYQCSLAVAYLSIVDGVGVFLFRPIAFAEDCFLGLVVEHDVVEDF